MKILFAAGESAPFIKTGGLGDVIGSLSKELADKGEDVRVILPKYQAIKDEFKKEFSHLRYIFVNVGWRRQYCGIETIKRNNVTFYFVDNEYYFKRGSLYGFYDEAERFAFFDRAVLEILEAIDWYPDIIHCNDWQCGMIPVLLKLEYKFREKFKNIKTVFSIHNLKFQGNYDPNILPELFGYSMEQYENGALKFDDAVSFMKGALIYSDKISTVSRTYAQEIKTAEYGERMDGILRYKAADMLGIVNGIDYEEFNPEIDDLIYENYDIDDMEGKSLNKRALQEELGLEVSLDTPIISMVTRLTEQKGIGILLECIREILKNDVQFVVLGTGDKYLEDALKSLEYEFGSKVSINILFDNKLAHKIYAGSDMFLMPSAFEPCGLGQLIALRYGTIPIVRETGGLKDTVSPFNKFELTGNGFSFYHYSGYELLNCVNEAIYIYKETDNWGVLVENAISSDNSWEKSSEEYLDVYKNLIK